MTDVLTVIPKPADRLDWLRVRHPRFNASDASCLYGANPWKSLADVVVEKTMEVIDTGTNEDMERGQRLEPFLLQWFGDKHGLKIVTPDVLYVCGRLMATLDGEPVGDSDIWIEAKTTRQTWHEVPEHVRYQVIAQAAASGKRLCHVVALDADMRFKEWEIEPTDDEIADLLARVEKFWSFLDLGMTPEGVEFTADQIAKFHPEPIPGSVVEVDGDDLAVVQEWLRAKETLSAAEKAEKDARDRLCRLLGEAEAVTVNGTPFVTWKAQTRSSVDTKSLLADHPELKAKYERTSSFRVLRSTKDAA